MSGVKFEVCTCCATSEKYIAEAVERIRAEHGDKVEIIPRKCLDVCQENGAVKINDEIMTVGEADVPALEAKVRRAAAER